jgi:hypothetical protein
VAWRIVMFNQIMFAIFGWLHDFSPGAVLRKNKSWTLVQPGFNFTNLLAIALAAHTAIIAAELLHGEIFRKVGDRRKEIGHCETAAQSELHRLGRGGGIRRRAGELHPGPIRRQIAE